MKKFLILLLLSHCVISRAQSESTEKRYEYYCHIVIEFGLSNCSVKIEFDDTNETLADADGKTMKFKTGSGALNYLSKRGWKIKIGDTLPEGAYRNTTHNRYHYIMFKEVFNKEEAKEGLKFKSDTNKVVEE